MKLLFLLIAGIPLFAQNSPVVPYPRHNVSLTTTGTSVPPSCVPPAFFVKTDASTLYVCIASTFVLIGGSGTPTGTAGGDLSGTYPNPSVIKVNGSTPGGTCTNQFVRSINSSSVPACASVATADLTSSSTTVNGQACALGSTCTVADSTKQPVLGFTAENVANKSTTTTLGASDTLYPSQNAVKTYVDVRGLRSLVFTFDGSGIALTTGKTAYLRIPFACAIVDWSLGSTTAETVTIKTWKIANGTAVPTVGNSISTSGVSLSTGTAVRSTTLSDFTSTTVTANDWIAASITAVTASQYVVFQLGCQQ